MLAGALACVALAQPGPAPQPAPVPAAAPPAVPPDLPDELDVPEVVAPLDFSEGRGLDRAMLERLNMLMPDGRAHEGLRYPIYREGRNPDAPSLESLFESRRVLRLDEHHLFFEHARFSSFDDARFPDSPTRVVSLDDALFDLRHDWVFTDKPVQLDERRMSIHSGGMVHDRATGLTIFTGGVELFLHEPPEAKAPAVAPEPVSAPLPPETPENPPASPTP
jgi:hypothetical protein